MFYADIPVIIPFKEKSIRCPNKNFVLFEYTYDWLKKQNVDDSNIYVVSESDKVKHFIAENYPNVNFVREQNKYPKDNLFASFFCAK